MENEDGSLNKDQVKRELADYRFMLYEVPKVYSEFAELSKPNYTADVIIREIDKRYFNKEFALDDFREMAEDNGELDIKDIEKYLR